jgi:hypothetical protein
MVVVWAVFAESQRGEGGGGGGGGGAVDSEKKNPVKGLFAASN